jgi:hypothetical protein
MLTRILGVFWAMVLITGVQDILVHERRTGRYLSEEGHFNWLSDLDALALLHEDLARVLAPILAIQGWYTILFGVVPLLERLESGHEIVTACNTMRNDTLSDTGRNGTLDDSSDRVHRTHDLGLVLGRDVELDLLEEIFRSTKSTDDKNVL